MLGQEFKCYKKNPHCSVLETMRVIKFPCPPGKASFVFAVKGLFHDEFP